jgi:hypothetical protein
MSFERPQLRRKVTFKRRSNVIQLTTFFESLNQQYEQELKEQQEKKGALAPEEEQKILSDSPYPFDFEEEEPDNEEQDSNTETESASEQQLNGSTDRAAPSKKDVYPGIYLLFIFSARNIYLRANPQISFISRVFIYISSYIFISCIRLLMLSLCRKIER